MSTHGIRMRDSYHYTEQLCANVRAAFVAPDKATKAALDHAQRQLWEAATALQLARGRFGSTKARLERSAGDTGQPLAAARATLRALWYALKSRLELGEWGGSLNAFFGGHDLAQRAHGRVVAALRTALASLAAEPSLPDRASWVKRLQAAYDALVVTVTETAHQFEQIKQHTTELAARRLAWQQSFDHLVALARGHLLIAGRGDEATAIDPAAAARSRAYAAASGRARRRKAAPPPAPPATG